MKKINLNSKTKKTLKIVKNVVQAIFIVFFIIFILMVCLQRFSDNKFSFFNYRMFTVASGSMQPKYNIGDVLISKNVDASEIEVGDTISYLGDESDFKDKVITHEVMSIEKDEDGTYLFHTKGTANIVEDPIVSESQLYGVVIYKCVILSFIYKIVGTSYGLLIFIILPLFYIIGSEIISTMLENEEKKRNAVK